MSETSDKSRRTRFNLKDIGCNEPFKDRGMPDLTGKLLVSLHEEEEGALGANLSTQRLRKQGARASLRDIRGRRVWLMLHAVSLHERSTCRAISKRCSGCP